MKEGKKYTDQQRYSYLYAPRPTQPVTVSTRNGETFADGRQAEGGQQPDGETSPSALHLKRKVGVIFSVLL